MNLTISFLAIILTLSSCSQSTDSHRNEYNDEFIQFMLPANWELESSDLSQKDVKMYSIGDTLKVSSFGLSLTIDSNEPIHKMNEIQLNILRKYIPHAEYSETRDTTIAGNRALYFNYSFKSALQYYGSYIAMKCDNKSININYQFSSDEKQRIIRDLSDVFNSIRCK